MGKRAKLTDVDRKRDRAGRGSLLQRQVSQRCARRYEAAVAYFFWLLPYVWGAWPREWRDRDDSLCHFLECLWSEGEAKSRAADTISGLQWHYGTKGCFPGAWRRYSIWNKLEISHGTPPLPSEALFALCAFALEGGHPFVAVTLYVAFHCLLRTGEFVGLQLSQLRGNRSSMTLVLTDTKTSKRHGATEYVNLDCTVARILVEWSRLRLGHGPLIQLSQTKFRSLWKSLVQQAGLDPEIFQPYSVRRGGATFDYIDSGSLDRSLLRGRWQSIRAARVYVREGEEQLARLAFSPAHRDVFLRGREAFLNFVHRADAELHSHGL